MFLGGLFGGGSPKQTFPAPFSSRYVPLSMIEGLTFGGPEHFIDRNTLDTLRVGNDGDYVKTGSINAWADADKKKVMDWLKANAVPDSKEAEAQKQEAARKVAEKDSRRTSQASTILTSPQGLLEPAQVNKKSLLGQ